MKNITLNFVRRETTEILDITWRFALGGVTLAVLTVWIGIANSGLTSLEELLVAALKYFIFLGTAGAIFGFVIAAMFTCVDVLDAVKRNS